MQSTSWEMNHAGWSTSWNHNDGRNINNLRYADDTTLTAESEELKSFLMTVKEEVKKLAWNSTFRKLRSWHLVPSVQFSSVAQSCPALQSHEPQHARPPCSSPTPRVHPNPCPLSRWCHPTISSSVGPSPPALKLSQHQGLFKWVSSSHQVARVLEFQLQHQSFQWILRTDFL